MGRSDTGEIVLKWVLRRLRNSEGSSREVVGDGVWCGVQAECGAIYHFHCDCVEVLLKGCPDT